MVSRRNFLLSAAGVVTGTIGVCAYTRYVEPTWLDVTARPMPIRNLPTSLVGKTLVQLSDIHVSEMVEDAYVLDTFARGRALNPDIVLYTGDFTSYHPNRYNHAESVYSTMVKGRLGTFASLGNHDYGEQWKHPEDAARITAILQNLGVTVLVNAQADVNGLRIVGLGDLWAHTFDPATAFAGVTRDIPTIAMSHNPDTVDLGGWESFDGWILSGHTHGGQCKPPFLPPPVLPVRNRRYTCGLFELDPARTMYISRGVGTYLPVRFNVRPEVTVFTLTAA